MLAKFNLTIFALAAAVTGGSTLGFTDAHADVYTRKEHLNRDVCYQARRVPATVAYNTRGLKLRDSSRSWEGNMHRHGARVTDRHNDEVYVQTRQIIEDQHMTLVPVRCR